MDRNRTTSPASHTLHTEWTRTTDACRKVERSTATARRTKVVRSLLRRTGTSHRLEVDHERRLREPSLVGDRWHSGDEDPVGLMKRLAGVAIAIGAIGHR